MIACWSAVSLTSNSNFSLWSRKIWSLPISPNLSLFQLPSHTSHLSTPQICWLVPASESNTCYAFGLDHYFLAHHGYYFSLFKSHFSCNLLRKTFPGYPGVSTPCSPPKSSLRFFHPSVDLFFFLSSSTRSFIRAGSLPACVHR